MYTIIYHQKNKNEKYAFILVFKCDYKSKGYQSNNMNNKTDIVTILTENSTLTHIIKYELNTKSNKIRRSNAITINPEGEIIYNNNSINSTYYKLKNQKN